MKNIHSIEYDTPEGKILFPAGSGGMINSNVLHMTKAISQKEKNIQLLHIFDVSLLAGEKGSRIEQKYISPVITAPQIEVIPLFPGNAEEERILKLLAASFRLSSDKFGYEIKLMMIYIHEHYREKYLFRNLLRQHI